MIQVEDLCKEYPFRKGVFRAVDKVSFSINKGEVLGLVGESGSGKSTLAKMLLSILCPTSGKILFQGRDITKKKERSHYRKIQMIFQDPTSSLNPRMRIEQIIQEPTKIHGLPSRVDELLEQVGLPLSAKTKYPHEFSGGQKQRVGIARALALNPDFLICDEPISSLDLSIQAQIMNLLIRLKQELELSLLFISHDLSAVRYISDRIAVMRQGKILELEDASTLYNHPKHPYTKLLLSSVIDILPPQKKEVSLSRSL